MAIIYFNGNYVADTRALFTASNRAFRYGDAVFESLFLYENNIPLLSLHIQRLQQAMQLLQMESNDLLSAANVLRVGRELAHLNNWTSVRLRLQVYRAGGGLYTPITNRVGVVITARALPNGWLSLNEKGLRVGIFTDLPKMANKYAAFKTANCLPYIAAAQYKGQHQLDDCLILNQQQQLCDAISSNIFLVKDGVLFTPPVSAGCVAGVMRAYMLEELTTGCGIDLHEESFTPADAFNADELWLSNAIQGIRWVKELGNIQYDNVLAKRCSVWLCRKLLG